MISITHWNVHMMVEIVVETMSIHNIAANANVLKVENSEMVKENRILRFGCRNVTRFRIFQVKELKFSAYA